jgi:hypothetical protein
MAGQLTSEVEERTAANESVGWQKSPTKGGNGGDPFTDDITQAVRLLGFVIRSGDKVDSIQAIYQRANGTSYSGAQHGGNGGTQQAFAFADGEVVTKISVHAGTEIDQITIKTNRTTYGPFGGAGGIAWDFEYPVIGGIFGRSGDKLDQLGVFYK